MKNLKILVIGIFITLCFSCSKSSSGNKTIFEGNYSTSCLDVDSGDLYIKVLAEFSGTQLTFVTSLYRDTGRETCEATSLVLKQTSTYQLSVGEDYTDSVVGGATKAYMIDLTLKNMTAIPYDNGESDLPAGLNNGDFGTACKALGSWENGVAKDIAGSECLADGGTNPAVDSVEYGFLDLNDTVSPVEIIPGDPSDDDSSDGSTPEKRHVDAGEIVLYKE